MQIQVNPKNAFKFCVVIAFIYLAYLIWGGENRYPQLEVELKEIISYAVLAAEMGGHAVARIYRESNLGVVEKGGTDVGKAELLTKADLVSNHLMLSLLRRFPLLKVVSEEKSEQLKDEEVDKYREDNYQLWLSLRQVLEKFPSQKYSLDRVTVWVDPLDATQEFTEGLTQYVTVMACVAVDGKPLFGAIFRPFTNDTVFGMVGYGLMDSTGTRINARPANEIAKKVVVSRSHAGKVKDLIQKTFGNNQYEVVPAGGSGYKTLELIKGDAELYIHTTAIKKWDICAGDTLIQSVGGALIDLKGQTIDYRSNGEELHKGGLLMALRKPFSNLAKLKKHLST